MPGEFIETPRPFQQTVPSTPFQNLNKSSIPGAPIKPHESLIFLGAPPDSPINLNITDTPSNNQSFAGLPRRSTRDKKQTDPGDGMVPNTQRYRANTVQFEPKTFKQAMTSDDH